jgi:hypothetical protein
MDRLRDGEKAVADTAHRDSEAEPPNKEAQLDEEPATPNRRLGRTLAAVAFLSVLVLGAAAAYALPGFNLPSFNMALPNLTSFAELFSRAPKPDPVLTTLKTVQSRQQQSEAAVHDNGAALQQNTALLRQSLAALRSLRQNFAARQTDLKKLTSQLSSLAARVDALEKAMGPLTTSSIRHPKTRAESRKRTLGLSKPVGPVSVGGAPLSPVPPPGWGAG